MYEELDIYNGSKTKCDNCSREFNSGEVIAVSSKGLIFCYTDAGGGCVIAYGISTNKPVFGSNMRFGVLYSISDQERAPNYPNTPIIKTSNESEKVLEVEEDWPDVIG